MGLFKKKTDKEIFLEKVSYYRDNYIPDEYNKADLIDFLIDFDIDHLIDISNRGDGKSFNYFGCLLFLSYELDGLGITFVVRHFELQARIRDFIKKVVTEVDYFNRDEVFFISSIDYVTITYKDKDIAIIADLNNASDLKFSSNILAEYPIILYEEFLALKTDYLPDEFEKLKLIYTSIDRKTERKYIYNPKILYLGNPVNFDSPILPKLNVYNYLQSQEINTIKKYNNIVISLRRNDTINERKNTRAFKDENSSDFLGEFQFPNYLLLPDEDYNSKLYKGLSVYIQINDTHTLHVLQSKDNEHIISVEDRNPKNETHCIRLSDETETKKYLTDKFYSNNFLKKHEKGLFLYKNSFSKNYIQSDMNLLRLKFLKCFNNSIEENKTEKVIEEKQKNDIIKSLFKKYEV